MINTANDLAICVKRVKNLMNKIFKSSVLINLVKNGWILCQPLEEGNPQVFLLDTEVSVRLDHLRG